MTLELTLYDELGNIGKFEMLQSITIIELDLCIDSSTLLYH